MIGNDIVDLKFAQHRNILRPRFLNKVFTTKEQKLIFNAVKPTQRAWLLWSMKESVYKLCVQNGGRRRFNPINFSCSVVSKTRGFVKHDGKMWYTTSKISKNYVVSQATLKWSTSRIRTPFCFENSDYRHQHAGLYNYVKNELSSSFGIPIATIEIKKNKAGIPQVYFHAKRQALSLSLSHHGNYGAIAWA